MSSSNFGLKNKKPMRHEKIKAFNELLKIYYGDAVPPQLPPEPKEKVTNGHRD
jgi:hypothetical protein